MANLTPVDDLLHWADNALVLGQRNAEWCGHGPILEEDLALANQSLDLVGQARLLYHLAAQRIEDSPQESARFAHLVGARESGRITEDTLAYFREAHEFRNHTLLELPHSPPKASTAGGDRDYATTIVRNFFYSAYMVLVWQAMQQSPDTDLANIASKSLKEARYHIEHASDWVVRMGDGTAESHAKAQSAVNHLMRYTSAFWAADGPLATALQRMGAEMSSLHRDWDQLVDETLLEATLTRPEVAGEIPKGYAGVHSEHLGFLLAEMQVLARAHPQASW